MKNFEGFVSEPKPQKEAAEEKETIEVVPMDIDELEFLTNLEARKNNLILKGPDASDNFIKEYDDFIEDQLADGNDLRFTVLHNFMIYEDLNYNDPKSFDVEDKTITKFLNQLLSKYGV